MPGLRDILEAATPGPWEPTQFSHELLNEDDGRIAFVPLAEDVPLIALAPELAAENLYAAEAIRAIVLDPEFPGRGPMTITRGQKELLADALARLDQLGKEQT